MTPQLPFDRRITEDQIREIEEAKAERLETLDAMREDRNRAPVGECWAQILPDPEIDIGM